jgi:ankyrin repeat protein
MAMGGFGAAVGGLAGMARVFRGDSVLWAVHHSHPGPLGRTHLMHAAKEGNTPRLQFLLRRGAAVGARDAAGQTALLWACRSHADRQNTVGLLLAAGSPSVNAGQAADGQTALMWACRRGHLEVARRLVQDGSASVNAATATGCTALMQASKSGQLLLARHLVKDWGASVSAALPADGSTALMMACASGHRGVARLLAGAEGAPVNAARTSDGATALMLACMGGYLHIAQVLCQHGADASLLDFGGLSARAHTMSLVDQFLPQEAGEDSDDGGSDGDGDSDGEGGQADDSDGEGGEDEEAG